MIINSLFPSFISFTWIDAIDIVLVSILLFQFYRIVKGSVAINIFAGILSVYFLWLIVKALKMQLLSTILGQFIGVGVIALIIVFQQELRRFLLLIGTNGLFGKGKWTEALLNIKFDSGDKKFLDIHQLVKAFKSMSESKTGAIVVITTKTDLNFYANTGETIKAEVSARLIESLFYKNSPMHDGAVIISDNTILAARCVLPVSENDDFPAHLGMRHRAAVGITENTDAIAIVVSEQTGEIAFVKNGELKLGISAHQLKEILEIELIK
ncbi:MAG: diadenylate cyclase CdaA [Bacteroidota bacterium]|jgi:diadenylate cyclase